MEHTYTLGLTYDDVLLRPSYTDFTRGEIDLTSRVTRNITLAIPVLASPMDTVTEHRLAIGLGRAGGLGFIHRNLTIEDQAKQVAKVKKSGVAAGAAVGSAPGFLERAEALVAAGADVLLVDSAHGYCKFVIDAVKHLKKHFKETDVIAGSIATAEGAKALLDAGADGLRVGMGPGAICTTRIISGMGVPQIGALQAVRQEAEQRGVPFIADGGINHFGDVSKAIAAGASSVMLGRLFAATKEAPGKTVTLQREQVPERFKSIINGADTYLFKTYRGMGSPAAMERSRRVNAGEEFHGRLSTDKLLAEGVEGLVPCSGSVDQLVSNLLEGLKSGMYYTGNRTIAQLQKARLSQITQASLHENHPHDLFVTNSGGVY